MARSEGFGEYVGHAWPRLLRSAWLLTGDWQRADDLVQTVLARAYGRWSQLEHNSPDTQLRAMLAATYLSWRWRRRRAAPTPRTDDGGPLWQTLSGLTPRERAVLMLRWHGDLTEAAIADALGVGLGTVRAGTTAIDRRVAGLVDREVPPIPRGLTSPRPEVVRRRARHRGVVAMAGGLSVLAAVTAVVVGVAALLGPSTVPDSVPTAGPDPTLALPAKSVRLVRVDRAGTGLTFYVNPSHQPCLTYEDAVITVIEQATTVVVSLSAQGLPIDCGLIQATPVPVRLAQPLGSRVVRTSDGINVRAYFDADLPAVPLPWLVVPVRQVDVDGGFFRLLYTRPGGPDLSFTAEVREAGPGDFGEVQLGSRRGALVRVGTAFGVQWTVRDLVYVMRLPEQGGFSNPVDEVREVIAQLDWP